MNISMLLEMVAEGAGDRTVVGTRAEGLDATELLRRAQRAAGLFRAAGVDHVAMIGLNSDAVPIALFGAGLAGLPFAPLNYRLTDEQLGAVLPQLVTALVIADDDMVGRVSGTDGLTVMSRSEFVESVASGDEPDDLPFVDPDEVAILLFTSGTTGTPKAAVLRHRHLTSYILGSVEYLAAEEDEAQLVSVPSYHIAGVSAILSSLYSGRRIVYLPGFDPESWVDTVGTEAVTQAMVVPTMLGRILDQAEASGSRLDSLRHLSYGGGRMPVETIERAMAMLPDVNFVNAYGLTETSSTVAVLTPGRPPRGGGERGRPDPAAARVGRPAATDAGARDQGSARRGARSERAGRDLRAGGAGGGGVPRSERPHRRRLVPDERRRSPRRRRLPLPRGPAR